MGPILYYVKELGNMLGKEFGLVLTNFRTLYYTFNLVSKVRFHFKSLIGINPSCYEYKISSPADGILRAYNFI